MLTTEEAERLLSMAVDAFALLDEAERRPSQAIPRDILTCGKAMVLVSALIHTIAEAHPELVGDERVADVASLYFRSIN